MRIGREHLYEYIHIEGHRNYMTDPAKRDESVKKSQHSRNNSVTRYKYVHNFIVKRMLSIQDMSQLQDQYLCQISI